MCLKASFNTSFLLSGICNLALFIIWIFNPPEAFYLNRIFIIYRMGRIFPFIIFREGIFLKSFNPVNPGSDIPRPENPVSDNSTLFRQKKKGASIQENALFRLNPSNNTKSYSFFFYSHLHQFDTLSSALLTVGEKTEQRRVHYFGLKKEFCFNSSLPAFEYLRLLYLQ